MNAEYETLKKLYDKLLSQKEYTFPFKGKRINAPTEKGVYIILDKSHSVVNVGSTPRAKNGLAQRLKNHVYGNSSFSKNYFKGDGNKLRQNYIYNYLVVDNSRERALLESFAIGHLCPVYLGTGECNLKKYKNHSIAAYY